MSTCKTDWGNGFVIYIESNDGACGELLLYQIRSTLIGVGFSEINIDNLLGIKNEDE